MLVAFFFVLLLYHTHHKETLVSITRATCKGVVRVKCPLDVFLIPWLESFLLRGIFWRKCLLKSTFCRCLKAAVHWISKYATFLKSASVCLPLLISSIQHAVFCNPSSSFRCHLQWEVLHHAIWLTLSISCHSALVFTSKSSSLLWHNLSHAFSFLRLFIREMFAEHSYSVTTSSCFISICSPALNDTAVTNGGHWTAVKGSAPG